MLSLFVSLAAFWHPDRELRRVSLRVYAANEGEINVFATILAIGRMSVVLDALPVDQLLLWAGGLMLMVVLLQGYCRPQMGTFDRISDTEKGAMRLYSTHYASTKDRSSLFTARCLL